LVRKTARDRRILALQQKIEQFRALLLFSRSYDREQRLELDNLSNGLPDWTNKQLAELESALTEDINPLVAILKPRRPLDYYAGLIADSGVVEGGLLFVPKWQLRDFFAGINDVLKGLDRHPEHTLVSFDVHGLYPRGTRGEVRILEAALFEDMCALFNRAIGLFADAAAPNASKPLIKECAALRRATVLAAFYTVEAYLNSIAFDFLINQATGASVQDLERITEWDSQRNRERLVSFREKLLRYPKIILKLEHPPLQENNCPEMKFLLEESKAFRDAIVHANPRPGPRGISASKELLFWRIGSVTPVSAGRGQSRSDGQNTEELWVKTIDSAIVLLEKLETVIHGNTSRLFWLQRRGPDGLFSASVFD
jgi:hypothetical protein